MKKIVAIGGGENGRKTEDGKCFDYETEKIDKEIILLTGKKQPNFLFICHSFSNSLKIQKSYYDTMKRIYKDRYGCHCKHLNNFSINPSIVQNLIKTCFFP